MQKHATNLSVVPEAEMQPRMRNPAFVLPDAYPAIQALIASIFQAGAPRQVLEFVHLRASAINGCSLCVEMGMRGAKKAGETDERLFAAAGGWRHAPYFSDAERAALALSEAATRLADGGDPVPDAIWDEAARHYDEKQLAAIVLWIGLTNFFNRLNVATGQVAGTFA